MKSKCTKIWAFLLVLAMALGLTACGGNPSTTEASGVTEAVGETNGGGETGENTGTTAATPGENQIVDGAGIIRDIPENPETVTMAAVYAVIVPLLEALHVTDRIVAVNLKSKFWKEADPSLDLPTVGRGVVDLEALATYAPDLFLHRSNDPETIEAVENLGIKTICVTVENVEDIKTTLVYLGRYLGAEEAAEEAISWIEGKFAKIDAITAQIPESEKKTALLMGGELGRIAGNDMLQSWMIEKAGGICVADVGEDHDWINVGVETVFGWNPDFIFCTSSTMLDYSPEELLADPTWSAMQAVKDSNIYIVPAAIDSWDMPGFSCVLGTFYMLYRMYPDLFSAEEMQQEIDDYYTFMFGKTFDQAYLEYSLD